MKRWRKWVGKPIVTVNKCNCQVIIMYMEIVRLCLMLNLINWHPIIFHHTTVKQIADKRILSPYLLLLFWVGVGDKNISSGKITIIILNEPSTCTDNIERSFYVIVEQKPIIGLLIFNCWLDICLFFSTLYIQYRFEKNTKVPNFLYHLDLVIWYFQITRSNQSVLTCIHWTHLFTVSWYRGVEFHSFRSHYN